MTEATVTWKTSSTNKEGRGTPSSVARTVINALVILDRAGEMPIRYGWFYGDGSFYNPEGFFKRFPEISGVGSAYLWNLGVGEEVIDSPSTGLCTPARVINPVLADRFARSGVDNCRINHPVMRAHVKDQIQYGRGVEYHGTDGTIDIILEIIDEIREETGMTVEEIREKRITLDHLFIVRPDQIPKLVEYGMVMAVSPGFLAANMVHNEKWNFLRLGNYIERADMTTRIIDVRSRDLLLDSSDLMPFQHIQWRSVLRSLYAMQSYYVSMNEPIERAPVLEFLIKSTQLPRAYARCLEDLRRTLRALPRCDRPLRACNRTIRRLKQVDVHELEGETLHAFLDDCQVELADLHDEIGKTYFYFKPRRRRA